MSSILMGIALKSMVVLAAAGMTALAARKCSAAARHLIWTAAMAALLALPLLSLSLPALHVAAADTVFAPGVTFVSDVLARADAAPVRSVEAGARGSSTHAAPWLPGFSVLFPVAIVAIWGAGTAVGLARLLFAFVALWRLRSRSKVVAGDLTALAAELGIRRDVRMIETAPGTMPMTFGLARAAIFLPSDAAEWSPERRRAVLLHELAHVRRGDVATQLLARVALSLYWWNPLAWTAWREFSKMSERAADDLVLDAGTRASEYAGHLLEVARSASTAFTSTAAVAMAQPSQLEGRLKAILDARVSRKSPGWAAAVLIALAAAAVVAPVAAIHAQDTQALPADVDATIRAATGQKNFDMLDRVATGFIGIKQYETAEKVLEASLAVRAAVAGIQSATYQEGLVKLGDLGLRRGHGSAETYYQQAIALGDRPGTASALRYLGIVAVRKEPAKAIDYLQRSINVDPKGASVPEATAWMGAAQAAAGNAAEAESLLSRAATMETDPTPSHALTMEMFADFLNGQGRKDEAESLEARAFKIRAAHVASLSPKPVDGGSAFLIGDKVTPPSVAAKLEPEYSLDARVFKVQGQVELSLVIGTDGKAGSITLKRGVGYGLDEKAVEAVSKWQFNPGMRGGLAVPVIATIQVNFRLL